jgi:tRNA modification GTPase
LDLCQAEAVGDVIHAQSRGALLAAQRHLRGCLGKRLSAIGETLVDHLAAVEAALDFPDDAAPPLAGPSFLADLRQIRGQLAQLESTEAHRSVLEFGVRIVLYGAPNGGKSSLFNALVGRNRALVSSIPGTTRDFLEECIPCGQWLLRFMDTAGMGDATDPVELMGMAKTREWVREADLILWVIDGSNPRAGEEKLPQDLENKLGIIILNKRDLPSAIDGLEEQLGSLHWPIRTICTFSPEDVEGLKRFIGQYLAVHRLFPDEQTPVVTRRQGDHLREALEALDKALAIPLGREELLAAELQRAARALGAIMGQEISPLVLDRIFEKFCIGK